MVRIKPLEKVAYGLGIDIRPIFLRVLIDESCPKHGKPIHFITTIQGEEPYNNCVDCLAELFAGLAEVCEEHTVAKRAIGG